MRKSPFGVRPFDLPDGKTLMDYEAEIDEMLDVLLGRTDPPIDMGVLTLMEVAEAYHARASEMAIVIQRGEMHGQLDKGGHAYKFRTGQLRTFMELTKRSIDLGSRRVTLIQIEQNQREGW